MKLYMDDVRECPPTWTLARTVKDAQAYLSSGSVMWCSLDHDMGDDPCEGAGRALDGTDLVYWLIETGHWPEHKPLVHSDNPDGRARMRTLIDLVYRNTAFGPRF